MASEVKNKPVSETGKKSRKNIFILLGTLVALGLLLVLLFTMDKKVDTPVVEVKEKQNSPKNEDKKKACKEENIEGCYKIAVHYSSKKKYTKAAEFFEKACINKDFNGCTALGKLYQVGKGVVKDQEFAGELFKQACDSHNTEGCYNLALLYDKDIGKPLNKKKDSTGSLGSLRKEKKEIDAQLKNDTSESFAKRYNRPGLVQVYNGKFPEDTERSYSLMSDAKGKVRYIVESPVSESGDWFVTFEYYYDTEGNLFALSVNKNMFNGCPNIEIVFEEKITYFDKKFKKIGKTITVKDKKKRKVDSKKCNLDFINFSLNPVQKLNTYLKQIKYKEIQNSTVNVPFVGTRWFNFMGGNGTGMSIKISANGDTLVQSHGISASSIEYQGKYTNPLKSVDGIEYLIRDNQIYLMENAKVSMDCMGDGTLCVSDLVSN